MIRSREVRTPSLYIDTVLTVYTLLTIGAYSYIAADGSGADYDAMAAAVGDDSGTTASAGSVRSSPNDCKCEYCSALANEKHRGRGGKSGRGGRGRGRVFFAGEATNRKHPVSAAGAYMSGVQAACAIDEALVPTEALAAI